MLKAAADWTLRDGLLVEPRLEAAGLRHGVTTAASGDMSDPARRAGLGSPLVLRQVHGTAIHRARPGLERAEGDGLVSSEPGLAVGVFMADCLPLLLWSDDGRTVGAFHAGWRGLASGMTEAAAEAMGGPFHAAVGPHIGPCCYEVGPELEARFAPGSFQRRGGRLFLDLGAEARLRLEARGVTPERIEVSSLCTHCEPSLYSWRRDGVKRSMLAFVAPV